MGARVDFLIRRLREETDALLAQLAGFAPEGWQVPIYPADPPWTAHSVLAHLVSAEGYLRRMIADVRAGGPGAPPGVDVDAINAAEVAALTRFGPAELIARLRAARAETIALVATFADEDLDRRGNHPVLGEMTLEDFIKLIYRHSKMHLRDVQHAQRA
ncbi:MAG: DinB family protein [Anaerolineae bacterium]|nr:DinB family protein [Anaerolineae bacterium]